MTTTEFDDIRERLDQAHIADAAAWAAIALVGKGVARVELTPGDLTRYPLTIVAPTEVWFANDVKPLREYVVALTRSGCGSSIWHPDNGEMHPHYAAVRWAGGNLAGGVVIAEFLNKLAARLGDLRAAPEYHR